LARGTQQEEVLVDGRLVSNDFDLLCEAAVAGVGIALLPSMRCSRALREGRLVRVLEEWASAEQPVHAVYPSSRLSAKLRALIDLLQERLRGMEI